MTSTFCIEPMTYLICKSLSYGVFPNAQKEAIVIPYLKINNQIKCFDLRPILVLPDITKVLVKIVVDQVVEFIEMNHIFNLDFVVDTAFVLRC